jgi:hypothetical protein
MDMQPKKPKANVGIFYDRKILGQYILLLVIMQKLKGSTHLVWKRIV